MKLPEKIKGRNKIRDAQILMAWGVDHEDTETIAKKFNLAERRILQILRANHKALPLDKEWEKLKRVERLQRWLKNKPVTSKDPVDIQEQLRKEIEGDKPLVDNSTHYQQIVYVRQDANSSNILPASRVPEAD